MLGRRRKHNHLLIIVTCVKLTNTNVSYYLPVAQEQMKIDELNPWFFPLPSDMCAITPGSNHDFTRSVYRAVVSSPVVMPDNLFSPFPSGNTVNSSNDLHPFGCLIVALQF